MFTDSFEAANSYAGIFRAQDSVNYNENGNDEESSVLTPQQNADEESDDEPFGGNWNGDESPDLILQQNAVVEESDDVPTGNRQFDSDVSTFYGGSEAETSIPADECTDAKDPLATVVLEEAVAVALSDVFDEEDNMEEEVIETLPDGSQRVVKDLGEDCHMMYKIGGDPFKPQESGYIVKINDKLSGNMAFKENVSCKNILSNFFIYIYICFYRF